MMLFLKSRFLAVLIFFTIFLNSSSGRTWDMAIAIGQEIDFLTKNGTLIGATKISKAKAIAGLAYDDTTHTLFYSENQNRSGSIYRLNITKKNVQPELLFNDKTGSYIIALVFDSMSRTLFWADALKQTVRKMHIPLSGNMEDSEIIHNLGKSPRTITIDVCNRHLYWGNSNSGFASIERSNLDGTNRTIIIKENLYEPVAVSVDHTTGKLYWIDDEEGIHYKIERSDLDGSNRESIFHGKHQQPVHISIDSEKLYWIDWVYNAVWSMNKNKKAGDIPKKLKSYYESFKDANPASVITRDNSEKVNCNTVFVDKSFQLPVANSNSFESFNNLTTSTEEHDFNHYNLTYCLNYGLYSEVNNSCSCKPGFQGKKCEISLCHNYCFQGTCTIDSKGQPVCQCSSMFNGSRCERHICYNYCLNDGECSIEKGKPTCKCKNFKGERCELQIFKDSLLNQTSVESNIQNVKVNECRCIEGNNTFEQITSMKSLLNCDVIVPILTSIIVLLTILVIILLYYMNKLRHRPKIKKRFIVSRSGNTPLTARPQVTDTHCEITIENCCNMNICETPCFEPKLRNVTSKTSKREEKKSLLVNMENNN